MAREDTVIAAKKQARGAVLSMLEDSYPTGLAYRSLEHVMAATGKCQSHELPGIIKSLDVKVYIHVIMAEEPQLNPLANSIIELAAHGVDLLEGSITDDVGIIF